MFQSAWIQISDQHWNYGPCSHHRRGMSDKVPCCFLTKNTAFSISYFLRFFLFHQILMLLLLSFVSHMITNMRQKQTVNIPSAYDDQRFDQSTDKVKIQNSDDRTPFKHKSILCMPINNSLGQIIGVIQLINKFDGLVSYMWVSCGYGAVQLCIQI